MTETRKPEDPNQYLTDSDISAVLLSGEIKSAPITIEDLQNQRDIQAQEDLARVLPPEQIPVSIVGIGIAVETVRKAASFQN